VNACPHQVELAALVVDGHARGNAAASSTSGRELVEARARALRVHAESCAACRRAIAQFDKLATDLRAPIAGVLGANSPGAFADDVVARLDEPRRSARWGIKVAALLAAAAFVAAAGLVWHQAAPRDEWASRGGASPARSGDAARRVLLRFGRVSGAEFDTITAGATIGPHDVLAAEVGHTGRGRFFLLAFVVDALGERHWIYPAYEVGVLPPSAEPLPATEVPRVLSTMTRLDALAAGPARIVGIVLPEPDSVERIESAPIEDLSRERLVAHYRNGLVIETSVVVGER
jgi:hypothetical protein